MGAINRVSEDSWDDAKVSHNHRDYDHNLQHTYKFCKNAKASILNGMLVTLGKCEGMGGSIPDSLLTISYKPPLESHTGTIAAPIPLHQPRDEFATRVSGVFNYCLNMAKKFGAEPIPDTDKGGPEDLFLGMKV